MITFIKVTGLSVLLSFLILLAFAPHGWIITAAVVMSAAIVYYRKGWAGGGKHSA